jgi:hypothetical protein
VEVVDRFRQTCYCPKSDLRSVVASVDKPAPLVAMVEPTPPFAAFRTAVPASMTLVSAGVGVAGGGGGGGGGAGVSPPPNMVRASEVVEFGVLAKPVCPDLLPTELAELQDVLQA